MSSLPADLYCNSTIEALCGRLFCGFLVRTEEGQEVAFSNWIATFCHGPCVFGLSAGLEDMRNSSVAAKVVNAVTHAAVDIADLVIVLASFCSTQGLGADIAHEGGSCNAANYAATNINKLLVTFMDWVHGLKAVRFSSVNVEGNIMIECSKFFTVLLPVLISLDVSCGRFSRGKSRDPAVPYADTLTSVSPNGDG